jgi:hypothetical protein
LAFEDELVAAIVEQHGALRPDGAVEYRAFVMGMIGPDYVRNWRMNIDL